MILGWLRTLTLPCSTGSGLSSHFMVTCPLGDRHEHDVHDSIPPISNERDAALAKGIVMIRLAD